MKVKVLQHHIDEGRRGNTSSCAIALAIKEQVPMEEGETLSVGPNYVFINKVKEVASFSDRMGSVKVTTPQREATLSIQATHFVQDFDEARPVNPFELELNFIDSDLKPSGYGC